MSKTGKTTGNLKMRSGPGMEYEPPVAYLIPDTELEILEELGDWLKVKAADKEGYVGHKYVAITGESAPAPTPVAPTAEEKPKMAPAAPTTGGIGKAFDREDEGGGMKKMAAKPKASGDGEDHAEGKINRK